ncbi:PQQ-binding-like beta-propeller repeat protein [Nonomuraea soli]|uniref:ABC transporter n=1 Tax=Nonomuraea soli TaxID=1032476 RepID=A0A7W0CH85_9ACTN|nr:PQQ-binding-like beta-propeller repeat protein [Nonomuraea soli]MBA2890942.1 hypothetical protein [Nonomuraea soli]
MRALACLPARGTRALACLLVVLGLAACGAQDPPPPAVPHGYVEGAQETAEPQARLVLADDATGEVHLLDLATGQVGPLGSVSGPVAVTGDGRFAFVSSPTGTHVFDSGGWTVDHGDHVHYYRAAPRHLGQIPGTAVAAAGDATLTALSLSGGTTVMLDRSRLAQGAVAGQPADGPADGMVVPYAEHLVVPVAGRVEVRGRDGAVVTRLGEPCDGPAGQAVTRRGAVIGCEDGALLVTASGAGFTATKIRYRPGSDAPRATAFSHRPGGDALTALAGEQGVWLLDTGARSWKLLRTPPPIAVNTAGAGSPVLVLDSSGVLHGYDPGTGRRVARTALLSEPRPGATIQLDAARAYVNDPAARAVHEIDYADRLRTARTFRLGFTPAHMVETGR